MTAPIIFALLEQQHRDETSHASKGPLLSNTWLTAVECNFKDSKDVDLIGKPMLEGTSGLERADYLSIEHINLAIDSLMSLKNNQSQTPLFAQVSHQSDHHLKALIGLALKVKTRKY